MGSPNQSQYVESLYTGYTAPAVATSVVNATTTVLINRNCLGMQTLAVNTASYAVLTVPTNALCAIVQPDGANVSLSLTSTVPTATVGLRLNDGVFYRVDSLLSSVKLIARSANTNVQIAYFDKVLP